MDVLSLPSFMAGCAEATAKAPALLAVLSSLSPKPPGSPQCREALIPHQNTDRAILRELPAQIFASEMGISDRGLDVCVTCLLSD